MNNDIKKIILKVYRAKKGEFDYNVLLKLFEDNEQKGDEILDQFVVDNEKEIEEELMYYFLEPYVKDE